MFRVRIVLGVGGIFVGRFVGLIRSFSSIFTACEFAAYTLGLMSSFR